MGNVVRLEEYSDHLSVGTNLLSGQFTIEKFINSGGFGITYLARNSVNKKVVIKECYPDAICRRSGTSVVARSAKHEDLFEKSTEVFVREAQNLARLEHPNIVHVHQVFEENNTAYMVLDFIDGRDFQQMIEEDRDSLTPDILNALLKKLLSAVKATHSEGILHRDISPDNILINQAGDPILIDFGAARDDVSKKSRILSTLNVIKDGYSPQEFYVSGSVQSDSSDLYALAATMYHAVSGEMPPNSQLRLAAIAEGRDGPYVPLAGRFDGYPRNFLEAIDKALEVIPKDRIQSAQDWLLAIDPEQTKELRSALVAPSAAPSGTSNRKKLAAFGGAALACLILGGGLAYTQFERAQPAATPLQTATAPADTRPATGSSDQQALQISTSLPISALPKSDRIAGTTPTAPQPVSTETISPGQPEKPQSLEAVSVDPLSILRQRGALIAPDLPALDMGAIRTATADLSNWQKIQESDQTIPVPDDAAQLDRAFQAKTAPARADQKVQPAPQPVRAPSYANEIRHDTPDTRAPSREFSPSTDQNALSLLAGREAITDRREDIGQTVRRGSTVAADLDTLQDRSDTQIAEQPPIFELILPAPEDTKPAARAPLQTALVDQPRPERAPEPARADAKTFIGDWELDLPFLLGDVVTDQATGSFPVITAVTSDADFTFSGDWIKPGVTVYAVNGLLLPPAQKVPAFLKDALGQTAPNPVSATARISRNQGAPAEDVVLQLGFSKSAKLANGLEVKQQMRDGQWQLAVTKLPTSGETTLQTGDILLRERSFGVELTSVTALVAMVTLLTKNKAGLADLSILRNGSQTVAGMGL